MEAQFCLSSSQFCLSSRKTESQTISVKCLVTQLLSQLQPLAVTHKSFIINDVPADFYATADKNNLTVVISSLLSSIISRSRSSCIRLSAKRYNNIILFQLRDSNVEFTHTPHHDWQEINMLAKKLGGCIIEDDIRKKHRIITFSFRSLSNAA